MSGSDTRNEWKNESLYIALKEKTFKTPSEMISSKKAERTIALAVFTLNDSQQYISAKGKLTSRNPEQVKRIFGNFDPNTVTWDDGVKQLTELAKQLHTKLNVNDKSDSSQ